jgi:hypothetical protein
MQPEEYRRYTQCCQLDSSTQINPKKVPDLAAYLKLKDSAFASLREMSLHACHSLRQLYAKDKCTMLLIIKDFNRYQGPAANAEKSGVQHAVASRRLPN